MKALVTYYSLTGNTEKVARAIFEALSLDKGDKELVPCDQVKALQGYDIIFVGFPVMVHSVPGKAQPLIRNLPAGQKIAFFSTHGSMRGGQLPRQAFEDAAGLAVGKKVLGQFGCRGKVNPKVIDALMNQPANRAWAEEARGADGHPDTADLQDAKKFAADMVAKAY